MLYDQIDLFGKRQRIFSYSVILQDKVKKIWWHRDDLEEEERNRLIIFEVLAECLERKGAIEYMRAAPSKEMAYRILVAALNDKDMPALETLSRGLRKAKADLEECGYNLNRNGNGQSEEIESYDELLVKIDKATTNRDSGLEHRFHSYLKQAIPGISFGHNEVISDRSSATQYTVDFVCRQYGLIVEINGYEFHNDLHSFVSDIRKLRELQSWGYRVLAFSGSELTVSGGLGRAVEEIKQAILSKSKG